MRKQTNQDFITIIRHVNERSLPLCLSSLKLQTKNIELINETPFIKAISEAFLTASKNEQKFVLVVDGDIILYHDAIKLIQEITFKKIKQKPNLAKISFMVFDKIRGKIKAGCHVFPSHYTSMLYEFYNKIDYNPSDFRPESGNFRIFKNQYNLDSYDYIETAVGVHDYEQSYQHIYVKHLNRVVKSAPLNNELLISYLKELTAANPGDHDYAIALEGCKDGFTSDSVFTDARQYPVIDHLLGKYKISEKEPLKEPEVIEKVAYYSHLSLGR